MPAGRTAPSSPASRLAAVAAQRRRVGQATNFNVPNGHGNANPPAWASPSWRSGDNVLHTTGASTIFGQVKKVFQAIVRKPTGAPRSPVTPNVAAGNSARAKLQHANSWKPRGIQNLIKNL